jgi:hypothetical protein
MIAKIKKSFHELGQSTEPVTPRGRDETARDLSNRSNGINKIRQFGVSKTTQKKNVKTSIDRSTKMSEGGKGGRKRSYLEVE